MTRTKIVIPEKGPLVAEGKTKRVYDFADNWYLIEHKDDITSGDGTRREILPGKGVASCKTTVNCFNLLEDRGIPTHFVDTWVEPNQMVVEKCVMIALEVVVRGSAAGSFLKRNPDVEEGTVFAPLVVEFFFKDDERHDPYAVYDHTTKKWLLFDPSKPLLGQKPFEPRPDFTLTGSATEDAHVVFVLGQMEKIARQVFLELEKAWGSIGGVLWDLKIEFGFLEQSRTLVVADVIDNDSWRVRMNDQQLDKQVFRDLGVITPEAMEKISSNYELVAELTSNW